MRKAERMYAIAQYLHSTTGRTLDQIKARFDVSERTVFRDIAALIEEGVPIVCETGRYRVVSEGRKREGNLDSTDLQLVRIALKSGEVAAKNGPLSKALARIINKLDQLLRDKKGR